MPRAHFQPRTTIVVVAVELTNRATGRSVTANTVLKPDASPGCAPACPEAGVLYVLESLTTLNNTEATESGVPLSVFSTLSGISGSTPDIYLGQLEQAVYDPGGVQDDRRH